MKFPPAPFVALVRLLRRDGFASLAPEGSGKGFVLTEKLTLRADGPVFLHINALCGSGGCIRAEITGRLRSRAMQGGTLAALDAIELIGSGLAEICDFTIAVTASDETRIARIMERDGISREKAELRIRAQRPNAWFEENCDFTLSNDGDRESFIRTLNDYLEERLNHGEHERKPVL